ncbi:neutral amino acid transporter A [Platysternon megacephalum]|uniref:Neutral amino acid transporter A n=1 Tax=Platysternon megacephalum TaxID=55544 RepID=A0A4D9E259_9SAUR|nr:neutral amino acid transporter A [Platysternon megacephalum]
MQIPLRDAQRVGSGAARGGIGDSAATGLSVLSSASCPSRPVCGGTAASSVSTRPPPARWLGETRTNHRKSTSRGHHCTEPSSDSGRENPRRRTFLAAASPRRHGDGHSCAGRDPG